MDFARHLGLVRVTVPERPPEAPTPRRGQPGHSAKAYTRVHHAGQSAMAPVGHAVSQQAVRLAALFARSAAPVRQVVSFAAVAVIAIRKQRTAVGTERLGWLRIDAFDARTATAQQQGEQQRNESIERTGVHP